MSEPTSSNQPDPDVFSNQASNPALFRFVDLYLVQIPVVPAYFLRSRVNPSTPSNMRRRIVQFETEMSFLRLIDALVHSERRYAEQATLCSVSTYAFKQKGEKRILLPGSGLEIKKALAEEGNVKEHETMATKCGASCIPARGK